MFNLETDLKLTKQFLLSKNTQEVYFEHYLGVPVKKGLFKSPPVIRADNTPTCSFYKNKTGNLIFKDFAGPSFDFIGCVMYLFNCSYYTAIKIIANDFGYIQVDKLEKNPPLMEYTNKELKETEKAQIQVEIKDFSKKELDWWAEFGISLNTLLKFKVFSIKSVFLNGNYFTTYTDKSPIYGYFGGEDNSGGELWRIYMPTKKSYRFISNWKSSLIQGVKMIPKSNDFIIVTKSLKDVMALYEFGIPAIAPTSENLFLSEAQYNKLKIKYKNIFLLYDNDLPGVKAANKIRKKFTDIKVIMIPKKSKCKDFSDYVKKYNTMKSFDLIDKFKKHYLNYG